jgi:hypothetical protein
LSLLYDELIHYILSGYMIQAILSCLIYAATTEKFYSPANHGTRARQNKVLEMQTHPDSEKTNGRSVGREISEATHSSSYGLVDKPEE